MIALTALLVVLAQAAAPAEPLPVDTTPPAAQSAPAPRGPTAEEAITWTYTPATRPRGIAALERMLWGGPDDPRLQAALARALAWEGRLGEALGHYDALLSSASPSERPTFARERAQVLLWSGATRDATDAYRAIVRDDPHDVDARIGLATALRWRGRTLAARRHASAAAKAAPDRLDARQALAWCDADLGRPGSAKRRIEGLPAKDLDPKLVDGLRSMRRPTLAFAATASEDSFDVRRFAPRAYLTVPIGDVQVTGAGGSSHLTFRKVEETGTTGAPGGTPGGGVTPVAASESDFMDATIGAVGVVVPLVRFELRAHAGVFANENVTHVDAGASVTARPLDGWSITAGARQRPLLEPVDPSRPGEDAFHGAGAGGALTLAGGYEVEVEELTLAGAGSPFSGTYLYADGRAFRLSDGNDGRRLAAGAGVNPLAWFRRDLPVDLFLRWDSFLAEHTRVEPAYFSPERIDVHGPGVGVHLRPWSWLEIAGSAGTTFGILEKAEPGFWAGGSLRVRAGRLAIAARIDQRDDLYYSSRRAWIEVQLRP